MNIDQTNGNIAICGWSLMASHQMSLYGANGKKHAINFLLDNLGDVQWHYSFHSILGNDLAFQSILFSLDETCLYSLL